MTTDRYPSTGDARVAVNRSCASHDLERPVRMGRAHYRCRLCGADISLELVFFWEALDEGEREDLSQKVLTPGHPDVRFKLTPSG